MDPILEPFWDPFWEPLGVLWGQGGQARAQKRSKTRLKRGIPKRTPQKKHFASSWRRHFEIPSIKNDRFSKSSWTPFWLPFGCLFGTRLAPEGSQGVPKACRTPPKGAPREHPDFSPNFGPQKASKTGGGGFDNFGSLFRVGQAICCQGAPEPQNGHFGIKMTFLGPYFGAYVGPLLGSAGRWEGSARHCLLAVTAAMSSYSMTVPKRLHSLLHNPEMLECLRNMLHNPESSSDSTISQKV